MCVWFVPFTSSLLRPSSLFVWCVNVFSLAFIILFPFPALVGKKKRQRKELFAWLAHIFSTSFYHVDHFLRPFSAWLQIKLFHISLCVLSARVCVCACVNKSGCCHHHCHHHHWSCPVALSMVVPIPASFPAAASNRSILLCANALTLNLCVI